MLGSAQYRPRFLGWGSADRSGSRGLLHGLRTDYLANAESAEGKVTAKEQLVLNARGAILTYLQQEELLGSNCLIVLIVDRSFRVLELFDEPLDNLSADLPQKVLLRALGARGSGVFLIETYSTADAFSTIDTRDLYQRIRHVLTETEIFVVDVLMVCAGQIRSSCQFRRTANRHIPSGR